MATKVAMISCLMMLARMTMVTSREPETPVINNSPKEDIYIRLDSPRTVECNASGYPAPKYTWYYSTQDDIGSPVTNTNPPGGQVSYDEISGELLIQKMDRNMEGYYNCHATTVFSPTSHATALSPNVKISVASIDTWSVPDPSRDEEVQVGLYAMLPCKNPPERSGPAEFGWFLSQDQNAPLTLDERQFIDNQGNLHFAYVKPEDQEVSYVCGLTSQAAGQTFYGGVINLKFTENPESENENKKPELKFPTKNRTTFELGQTGNLSCFFSAYDNGIIPAITWKDKYNNTITAGKGYAITNNGRTLVIDPVKEEHEGFFFCQPDNFQAKRLNVNVTSPPIPVKTLEAQRVVQGRDAHLSCEMKSLTGEVPPEMPEWLHNGSPMDIGSNLEKNVFSKDLKTLTIKGVDKANTSCFQCLVKNSVGSTMSSICLYIVSPITVYKKPKAEYVISKGDAVNFTVGAVSDPDFILTYTLFFNNESVMSSTNGTLYINTSGYSDQQMKDFFGNYHWILSNGVENVTVVMTVKEYEAPGPVIAGFPFWIIGLILAILLLLLIIIICCCVYCRRKMQEGDYPVDRKETAAGLDPEKEVKESAFPALSRADDPDQKKKKGSHLDIDDDYSIRDDSFGSADYGEDEPSAFNEDGSFIGVYKNKPKNPVYNPGYQNTPQPPHKGSPIYRPGSESNV